ncbi:MAG TPA: hypothetical protein VKT73_02730 [Xanthobacteraceae bacterium]|nr:hypothetical protein [Xanthobacteraceae bacterium]
MKPNGTPPAPSIFIGTPCFGGLVTTGYMMSALKLMQYGEAAGFSINLNLLGRDSLVTRSRNTLVAQFLTTNDTHLMFIDSDITFEPELIHRMLAFDQDVVAGMYPAKAFRWDVPQKIRDREPPQTAGLQYVGKFCEGAELERRGPFATGVYCATGFTLMKRSVIERLIKAYPERAYSSDHVYVPAKSEQEFYALFECMIDPETKEYLSEDFGFCRLWRALGGKIWLDVEGALVHTGPYDFAGEPALRFGSSQTAQEAPLKAKAVA